MAKTHLDIKNEVLECMSEHHSGNVDEARLIINAINERFVIKRRRKWSIMPWVKRKAAGIKIKWRF